MSSLYTLESNRYSQKLLIKLPAVKLARHKALCSNLSALGGVDAACFQLSRGFEVSPLNQQKLFGANYGTEEERRKQGERVASEYVRQIGDTNIFELNDDTNIFELDDKVKKSFLSTPERELKRLFLFVLDHSTQVRFSFAGKAPDEPWIAAFCSHLRATGIVQTHTVRLL